MRAGDRHSGPPVAAAHLARARLRALVDAAAALVQVLRLGLLLRRGLGLRQRPLRPRRPASPPPRTPRARRRPPGPRRVSAGAPPRVGRAARAPARAEAAAEPGRRPRRRPRSRRRATRAEPSRRPMLHCRPLPASLRAVFPERRLPARPPKTEGREVREMKTDYEILLMLDPELPRSARTRSSRAPGKWSRRRGGTWDRHDAWGRRRLAYEIDHKQEGTYHLLVFDPSPRRWTRSRASCASRTVSCDMMRAQGGSPEGQRRFGRHPAEGDQRGVRLRARHRAEGAT